MKLTEIKLNDENPRAIKDANFDKLVKSIIEFPQMMSLRPIVIDETKTVLGGNMRFSAILELERLGVDEVLDRVPKSRISPNMELLEPIFKGLMPADWVKMEKCLTEEQKKEFIIKDNVGFGDWDFDVLENWDKEQLEDWGVDLPDIDFSAKNKEIDPDDFDDEMIIRLKYTADEYDFVKKELSKIASTPEQAVWRLLGNE